MPKFKHERHGIHIASMNEREELEKNGWELVEEQKTNEKIQEILDNQEETTIIPVRDEPQLRRSPGRPKK